MSMLRSLVEREDVVLKVCDRPRTWVAARTSNQVQRGEIAEGGAKGFDPIGGQCP